MVAERTLDVIQQNITSTNCRQVRWFSCEMNKEEVATTKFNVCKPFALAYWRWARAHFTHSRVFSLSSSFRPMIKFKRLDLRQITIRFVLKQQNHVLFPINLLFFVLFSFNRFKLNRCVMLIWIKKKVTRFTVIECCCLRDIRRRSQSAEYCCRRHHFIER